MSYVYQEFPRLLYGVGGETLVVESELEKRAALEEGWRLLPEVVGDAPSPVPSDPGAPPVLPKRRGRPPKVRPEESVTDGDDPGSV